MRRRRRVLAVGAVSIALAMAIGAACSFPSVEFVPLGTLDAPSGSEGSTESGADGPVGNDGGADAPQDAVTRGDSSRVDGEAGCGGDPCDCDDDKKKNGSCPSPDAAIDCDDFDPLIFPGQDFVGEKSWESPVNPRYDWDCNGSVTKQYKEDLKCTLSLGCSGEGFKTPPGCGVEADYFRCNGIPALCDFEKIDRRTQGCK